MTEAELGAKVAMWDDPTILAGTAWGESRGVPRDDPDAQSSIEERVAVMWVVKNRLAHYAQYEATAMSYRAICLAPNQFDCWWGTDSNTAALFTVLGARITDLLFLETLYLARGVMAGTISDRTQGATMYFAPGSMKPGSTPPWAVGKVGLRIGDQLFFKI